MDGRPAAPRDVTDAESAPPRDRSALAVPFDTMKARRLLEAATALPDNARARDRGSTYHTIFALCYGLGLRAGEACGLLIGDVELDRQLLVVRGGKLERAVSFHTARASATFSHARSSAAAGTPTIRCSASTGDEASIRVARVRSSTGSS